MIRRKLKIYGRYRNKDKRVVPETRLIGQWIEALGFEIGDAVVSTPKVGSLD